MSCEEATEWLKELNKTNFAGYYNWRLPTLEEAMSLMKSVKEGELYIDPVFDKHQESIWTSDIGPYDDYRWIVIYNRGLCEDIELENDSCVRAVRSIR